MKVSNWRDRGQESSNRECLSHIGAVGTYGLHPMQGHHSTRTGELKARVSHAHKGVKQLNYVRLPQLL